MIVSKAVGNAVKRNLIRRRLHTIIDRQLAIGFSGVDTVIRVLPAAAEASFSELESEVSKGLEKARSACARARS